MQRVLLADGFPELSAQWHPTLNYPLTPADVTPGMRLRAWWQCDQNSLHVWQASLFNRTTAKATGCPFCANRKVLPGDNDFASKATPGLLAEWHPSKNLPLTASNCIYASDKKIWWQCEYGHEWTAPPNERLKGVRNCPYCAGQRVIEGLNDLRSQRPSLAAQFHPTKNGTLGSNEICYSSNKQVWWLCEKDARHEWETSPNQRNNKMGCPFCTNRMLLKGYNDLATTHPAIAAEWDTDRNHPLTPSDVTAGSDAKVWWRCNVKPEHCWISWVYSRKAGHNCPKCATSGGSSAAEGEIRQFVESLGRTDYIPGARNIIASLPRYEIDLYFPTSKFGIEVNGTYWHSEAGGKDKTYHANKMQACRDSGIDLFQVWSDDWIERPEVIKRMIAYRLGALHAIDMPPNVALKVGARLCEIGVLNAHQAKQFLDNNHLQGFVRGTHYYGLLDKQKTLRAVLVLLRSGSNGTYRIERYATLGVVQGGFTKLLKAIEELPEVRALVTFADLSISEGKLYQRHGFTLDALLPPDYSYLVGNRRQHKFNYRIARFKRDPDLAYEDGLSEKELADLNGLVRVWDSGKLRFVKHVTVSSV